MEKAAPAFFAWRQIGRGFRSGRQQQPIASNSRNLMGLPKPAGSTDKAFTSLPVVALSQRRTGPGFCFKAGTQAAHRGEIATHAEFLAELKTRRGRKYGFWQTVEEAGLRQE